MDDFPKTTKVKEICHENILNLIESSFRTLGSDIAEYIVLLELESGAISKKNDDVAAQLDQLIMNHYSEIAIKIRAILFRK